MYKKEFGKNIKRYRKLNGLSQEQLGKLLSTTKQNISSWEHDRTQPSNEDLKKMADIFNCNIDDITNEYFETFLSNTTPKQQDMLKDYYLNKEAEFVIKAYVNAPESIKEAVCKLLDVNREMFNISKYLKEGD